MTYTLEEIKTDILRRLGIIPQSPSEDEDAESHDDASMVGMRIRPLIPMIGAQLIMEAPLSLIGDAEGIRPSLSFVAMPSGLKGAVAEIDSDVLRIVSVKMASWREECSDVIDAGDPRTAMRRSQERGISGGPDSPKCYVVGGNSLRRILLCGSADSSDTLDWLKVWKIPSFTPDGRFSFPALLYPQLLERIISIIE